METADNKQLEQCIGHYFSNEGVFVQALTHRSIREENNERLEFLGDAILSLVIAEQLYHQFPSAREGDMSRWRASLVKGETLAELARDFNVGDYLRLGVGEQRSGGARRDSILANAMEAIIGAIYLDAGIETCKKCILSWFDERLKRVHQRAAHKDPKTQLQEWLQARGMELPCYTIVRSEGRAHEQIFYVRCQLSDLAQEAVGEGKSRRRAEQQAASILLEELSNESRKA